jgi:hypothetical protein
VKHAQLTGATLQVASQAKRWKLSRCYGNPDNIFTERLWRTVKYEEVYLEYTSPHQAREGLSAFIRRLITEPPQMSALENKKEG